MNIKEQEVMFLQMWKHQQHGYQLWMKQQLQYLGCRHHSPKPDGQLWLLVRPDDYMRTAYLSLFAHYIIKLRFPRGCCPANSPGPGSNECSRDGCIRYYPVRGRSPRRSGLRGYFYHTQDKGLDDGPKFSHPFPSLIRADSS